MGQGGSSSSRRRRRRRLGRRGWWLWWPAGDAAAAGLPAGGRWGRRVQGRAWVWAAATTAGAHAAAASNGCRVWHAARVCAAAAAAGVRRLPRVRRAAAAARWRWRWLLPAAASTTPTAAAAGGCVHGLWRSGGWRRVQILSCCCVPLCMNQEQCFSICFSNMTGVQGFLAFTLSCFSCANFWHHLSTVSPSSSGHGPVSRLHSGAYAHIQAAQRSNVTR